MTDIALVWNDTLGEGDLNYEDNDFELEEGFATAVFISLFTDRRAEDDDILPDPNSTDKRGFWGDQILPDEEGDQIGSRLWLLDRSKTIEENLGQAEIYMEEALQWMVDDAVVVKFEATAERLKLNTGTDIMALSVNLFKKDGTTESFTYNYEWENT